MKIAIAYNAKGTNLADPIKSFLHDKDHEVHDFGILKDGIDETDVAYEACKKLPHEHIDRAILICGAGQCTCIVANKFNGLYAASCNDAFEAHQARQHFNTNVLCLSARWLDTSTALKIVEEWLQTPFDETTRNSRSIEKIKLIEKTQCTVSALFENKE